MAFSYDQNRCRGVWEDDDAKNIDVQDEVDTNEDIHSKKKHELDERQMATYDRKLPLAWSEQKNAHFYKV